MDSLGNKAQLFRGYLLAAAALFLLSTVAPSVVWAQKPLSLAEARLGVRLVDSSTLSGVLVKQIVHKGAADRAGIKARDLILRIQGTPIEDLSHFRKLVLAAPEGQPIPVELLHRSRIESRTVVLPPLTGAAAAKPGQAPPTGLTVTIVGDDGQTMVLIPAGEFIMGEEEPRRIYLDAFYIDQYEVTNALWDRVMPISKRRTKSLCDRCPVIIVSWYEAARYCKKVGKRLPTDPEWEKAARGPDGMPYVWGTHFRQGLANVKSRDDKFPFTAPIGSFSLDKSTYGVFDLAGNVSEWTASWYMRDYEDVMPRSNPKGPERGDFKVFRGGSWKSRTKKTRTKAKDWSFPEDRLDTLGFRCAKSASGS